jgi:hypothetical protein
MHSICKLTARMREKLHAEAGDGDRAQMLDRATEKVYFVPIAPFPTVLVHSGL